MRRDDELCMLDRKATFMSRTELYRSLGFDRIAAAEFVSGAAKGLRGPALDIGTGKGTTAISLARCGLEVISVDTDRGAQEFAEFLAVDAGLGDRVSFVCGDAASLGFPDGAFGCVASMDALHHFEKPRAVLGEMTRVLRASGTLILSDFTPEGFEIISSVHRRDGCEHPVAGVTLKEAESILAETGFKVADRKRGHHHDVSVLVRV